MIRIGVWNFGWICPTEGGSRPSRHSAKPIRPIATMSTRITELRPAIAAMLIRIDGPAQPDLVEGVGDRGALGEVGVVDHPGEHQADPEVEHRADDQRADQSARHVLGGVLGLLTEVGHRLEAAVGEEHDGGGHEDTGDAERRRLDPADRLPQGLLQPAHALSRLARRDPRDQVGGLDEEGAEEDHEDADADLDHDERVGDQLGLADADGGDDAQHEGDGDRAEVDTEFSSPKNASGSPKSCWR